MTRKFKENDINQDIVEALKKLPKEIYDKKHKITICVENDLSRSNETRFEHIAKRNHELKVRDIESIPKGICKYLSFKKSVELNETYYYFIKRRGDSKGLIQVAIKLFENDKTRAYIKTAFITYRLDFKKTK